MKNKINQNEIMVRLLLSSAEEQESEIENLKNQVKKLTHENKLLGRKREHLLQDKLTLQNKLKKYEGHLKQSICTLRDTKFIKAPLKKYSAYKAMITIFHTIK